MRQNDSFKVYLQLIWVLDWENLQPRSSREFSKKGQKLRLTSDAIKIEPNILVKHYCVWSIFIASDVSLNFERKIDL